MVVEIVARELLSLSKRSAKLLLGARALSGAIEDCLFVDRGGNFLKRVHFSVSDRLRKISIHINEDFYTPNKHHRRSFT